MNFAGTLLLVSHDRALLDNVVTSTLVFEGDGVVRDYVGGYEDWLQQRPRPVEPPRTADGKAVSSKGSDRKSGQEPDPAKARRGADKLSYKETRELAELPERIEALEQEQAELHGRLADPSLYQKDGGDVVGVKARLEELDAALATAYARWEMLAARE